MRGRRDAMGADRFHALVRSGRRRIPSGIPMAAYLIVMNILCGLLVVPMTGMAFEYAMSPLRGGYGALWLAMLSLGLVAFQFILVFVPAMVGLLFFRQQWSLNVLIVCIITAVVAGDFAVMLLMPTYVGGC